jgi:SAM-dependent methyltransferase
VTEFTGERVIPGEVNDDLWAEHSARYAFASRYGADKRVLDVGCGTGYGVAELAQRARFVSGVDVAAEALTYARAHYPLANAHFVQATAATLPFADQAFDLATAFEVIEHLSDWRSLLAEARRVLRPDGVFLVSTPNKLYYAHEFEFAEFRDALSEFFPSVSILLQNRTESFAFYPHPSVFPTVDARMDGTRGSPEQAHFFLAVCARGIPPEPRSFVYVPRASNLLREREQHIFLLTSQLDQALADRKKVYELYQQQTRQLEEHNLWALQLDELRKAGLERIVQLQDELTEVTAGYARRVAELQEENLKQTEWAIGLSASLAAKCADLAEAVRLLDTAESTVVERTLWAQQLQSRLETLEAQFRMLRESRWLKLGRAVGLGPRVDARVDARVKD